MPEYRILENKPEEVGGYMSDKWIMIGEGFQSFIAVWWAIWDEMSSRLITAPAKVDLKIQRVDAGSIEVVAAIQIDDHKTSCQLVPTQEQME